MYTDMEMWSEIRRRVLGGEISKRAACQEYGLHWDTLTKILSHAEPPGYRSTKSRASKLEPWLADRFVGRGGVPKSDRARATIVGRLFGEYLGVALGGASVVREYPDGATHSPVYAFSSV